MEHKIFQISNIHFYFKIFFENGKLYKLTFSDNKNDLIDQQLSLKINEGIWSFKFLPARINFGS